MNRIFKTIFSKTLGTNVVAGETAKSHGKKSLKAVVAVSMVIGTLGISNSAVADITETSTITVSSGGNQVIGAVDQKTSITTSGTRNFRNEGSLTIQGTEITFIDTSASENNRTQGLAPETGYDAVTKIGNHDGSTSVITFTSAGDAINILRKGSKLDINASRVIINSGGAGIWGQGNTASTTVPENAASISIVADSLDITSTKQGIVAFSNSQVDINADTTIAAEDVILVRGHSTVNINKDSVHKTVLNGDINFNFDKETSGTTVDADILVNLNGPDSYWNGNTKVSWGTGKPDDSAKLEVHNLDLTLSNGAQWNPTLVQDKDDDNDGQLHLAINQLTLEDGVININNGEEQTVEVEKLQGSGGTINIKTKKTTDGNGFDAGKFVTGDASGSLKVNYTGISADDVNNSQEAMKELSGHVKTPGASVTNNVAEGDVAGAMTWSSTTNDAGQAVVSNVTEAKNSVVSALNDIGSNNFLVFRAQMNDLDKRMGDLRIMPNSDGAWARVIAGQSQYKSSHNTYQTLQVGADHRIGNFVLGGMASYTDGDGTQKNGSTDDKNYSFGLYGAWLGDDGQFIDVTLKRHHTESDYDLRYTDGTKAKGSLDTSGTSISAEYGWRLGIEGTNYYIEPQVEFMYGHMNSFGYKTSNGVKVKQDAIKTAVGRIGMAAGWVDPNKAGSAYLKVSVLNDWEGDSYSKASKEGVSRKYHEDMGGTWVEYAIGGTYNLSKNLSIYGEAETTSGNPVRTTYQFSAGMRYSF